jgi:hypothetical protein
MTLSIDDSLAFHQADRDAVVARMASSSDGLSADEVRRRLEQHGPNALEAEARVPLARGLDVADVPDPFPSTYRGLPRENMAIVGGTAALETTWIERIEDVDLDDLNPESLWRFALHDFGPLLVAMDSHGGSLYRTVQADTAARRAQVLASLGVKA